MIKAYCRKEDELKRFHVSFSNPYLRALIVNLVLSLAAFLRIMQDLGSNWTPRHTIMFSILGVVCFITTLLVGTLARASFKPWTWLKFIFISVASGLAVCLLLLLVQKTGLLR